jgi:hypothetical protein
VLSIFVYENSPCVKELEEELISEEMSEIIMLVIAQGTTVIGILKSLFAEAHKGV